MTFGGAAIGDGEVSRAAFRTRAVENFVYLVVSQRGSGSMIISPKGTILAEAKGLRKLALFYSYGIRNALLPQVTGLALALGTVVSSAIVIESPNGIAAKVISAQNIAAKGATVNKTLSLPGGT